MKLFTKEQINEMKSNGLPENRGKDHNPVVKIFAKGARMVWLFSEIINSEKAFGLCDTGSGNVELGYVHFDDLTSLERQFDIKICIDKDFKGHYPISIYESASLEKGKITTEERDLSIAFKKIKHLKLNTNKLPQTLIAFGNSTNKRTNPGRRM